jgi:hypothetical protein
MKHSIPALIKDDKRGSKLEGTKTLTARNARRLDKKYASKDRRNGRNGRVSR